MTKELKHKIAVYGSLRKGLYNYERHLKTSKYLGEFDTLPEFSMFDLGSYPGLKVGGSTSIKMDVFEVTEEVLSDINNLEGYSETNPEYNTFYDRITIDTPYGQAFTYIYIPDTESKEKVYSGDWVDHFTSPLN